MAVVRVRWDSGALEVTNQGADEELVQEIFVAMFHFVREQS
jgi:hypothetical protein